MQGFILRQAQDALMECGEIRKCRNKGVVGTPAPAKGCALCTPIYGSWSRVAMTTQAAGGVRTKGLGVTTLSAGDLRLMEASHPSTGSGCLGRTWGCASCAALVCSASKSKESCGDTPLPRQRALPSALLRPRRCSWGPLACGGQ